ncbi:MAG TPA: hypothetical protein H9717_09555 [Candidatus Eisenbergiella merdipullorum]|uniref:Uncharacterized protein n=1 Tax=Candidatus Eisenbergiella merdipullorum TaxID=2838553 RepID=A0A9D2I7N7_9FIRM|nr:hypothetical protein [Candidatus Eisenbergiella merdipullorum]
MLCDVNGAPNFPARMGCELYRRVLSHRHARAGRHRADLSAYS